MLTHNICVCGEVEFVFYSSVSTVKVISSWSQPTHTFPGPF